ncbi:Unknown protein, partial [Striga hermonthica]
ERRKTVGLKLDRAAGILNGTVLQAGALGEGASSLKHLTHAKRWHAWRKSGRDKKDVGQETLLLEINEELFKRIGGKPFNWSTPNDGPPRRSISMNSLLDRVIQTRP